MKKIKFCELQSDSKIKKEAEFFLKFSQSQGIEFDYQVLDLTSLSIDAGLKKSLENFDLVRCSFEDSNLILEHYEQLPTDVRGVSGFDLIQKEANHNWPRLQATKVLREMIVKKSPYHNLTESAYVVCDSSFARALVSILIQMGHKKVVLVTGQKKEHAIQDLNFLQQTFLGADIRLIDKENLTTQNDRASVLLSAIDLKQDEETLKDLIYFNFMASDGLVVDLNLEVNLDSALINEAASANLKTISSLDYRSEYDLSLLRLFETSFQDSSAEYAQLLQKSLSET